MRLETFHTSPPLSSSLCSFELLSFVWTDELGLDGPAAVHAIYGAGDHRSVIGCQERRSGGHIKKKRWVQGRRENIRYETVDCGTQLDAL